MSGDGRIPWFECQRHPVLPIRLTREAAQQLASDTRRIPHIDTKSRSPCCIIGDFQHSRPVAAFDHPNCHDRWVGFVVWGKAQSIRQRFRHWEGKMDCAVHEQHERVNVFLRAHVPAQSCRALHEPRVRTLSLIIART